MFVTIFVNVFDMLITSLVRTDDFWQHKVEIKIVYFKLIN